MPRIATQTRYGALQDRFAFAVPDGNGYQVLVGANNSGKSAILQLTFRELYQNRNQVPTTFALLLPDRTHVLGTGETGGRILEQYNADLFNNIQSQPMTFENTNVAPLRNELPRVLLTHGDYFGNVARLNEYLPVFGLPRMIIGAAQVLAFSEISVPFQGSGLRSLLTILAALTDQRLSTIIIDEPESSLEPRTQKTLRDLFIEESKRRQILVATHSHLFLNRDEPSSNYVVANSDGVVSVETVQSHERLYEITFELLGNDTEDLFFPGNYLVVEGASDQVIAERVLELLDVPKTRVKVLAGGNLADIRRALTAVLASLRPLVVHDSPYANRVVALIDQPPTSEEGNHAKLRKDLGDRLFVLSENSLEEYLPAELYAKCGRNKDNDLREIVRLTGDKANRDEFKRQLSNQIAASLTREDLDSIPIIRDAANRAANWQQPASTAVLVADGAKEVDVTPPAGN